MFPNNPAILLSVVNLKLRDQYDSFGSLCEDLDWDQENIQLILKTIGYVYDPHTNQFKAVGEESES